MTDHNEENEESKPIRPFMDTLRDLEHGELLEQLGIDQRKVLEAVKKTNCKGSLTLKLSYKPVAEGQITLTGEISTSLPKQSRAQTLFFITDEDNLSRDNPRQHKLPLRDAATPEKTPIKEAN